MAKRWRRNSTGPQAVALPAGPVLSDAGAQVIQVDGLEPYFLTAYLYYETSADGMSGWIFGAIVPIDNIPMTIDGESYVGQFFRAAVTHGDDVPITQWSNVFQVPA